MTVRFAEFLLDAGARQLVRAGQEVHLGPKAFDLLCTLVKRRPQVVSKADLIAVLWPETFVVEANLNVLIGEVRRALGDDPHAPRFVRTVHRVGYAFCADAADAESAGGAGPGGTRCWLTWKNLTFPLFPGENVIGRDPASDVWLDHAGVSRRHARLQVEGDPLMAVLTDLDSTNGTFVGGQRLVTAAALQDGDVFTVGSIPLRFRAWSDAAAHTRRIRRKPSPR